MVAEEHEAVVYAVVRYLLATVTDRDPGEYVVGGPVADRDEERMDAFVL